MNFFFYQTILCGHEQGSLNIFFVVLARIQTFFFFTITYAERNNEVDEFEDDKRNRETVYHCISHRFHLDQEESRIAIGPSVGTRSIHSLGSKNSGHHHTYHTTDTMTGKYIECIIQH